MLKFIGDGMLAIFELRDGDNVALRCAAALSAARAARAAVAARNPDRIAAGLAEIRYGLALHLGEVTYGNIGAPNRLDFTVIGPAVNHATRIEKVAAQLDRRIVTSASFAAAAEHSADEPRHALAARRRRTAGSFHTVGLIVPG